MAMQYGVKSRLSKQQILREFHGLLYDRPNMLANFVPTKEMKLRRVCRWSPVRVDGADDAALLEHQGFTAEIVQKGQTAVGAILAIAVEEHGGSRLAQLWPARTATATAFRIDVFKGIYKSYAKMLHRRIQQSDAGAQFLKIP